MIEIIKDPKKGLHRMNCSGCGCVFSYSYPSDTYQRINGGLLRVKCPSCDKDILHSNGMPMETRDTPTIQEPKGPYTPNNYNRFIIKPIHCIIGAAILIAIPILIYVLQ